MKSTSQILVISPIWSLIKSKSLNVLLKIFHISNRRSLNGFFQIFLKCTVSHYIIIMDYYKLHPTHLYYQYKIRKRIHESNNYRTGKIPDSSFLGDIVTFQFLEKQEFGKIPEFLGVKETDQNSWKWLGNSRPSNHPVLRLIITTSRKGWRNHYCSPSVLIERTLPRKPASGGSKVSPWSRSTASSLSWATCGAWWKSL